MRQFRIILISVFSFVLTGCSLVNENTDSFKLKYYHSTSVTNFTSEVNSLLNDLCPTLKEIKRLKKDLQPLYITDFVNLEELENHSELGFMLSDELKTLVTQKCDWPVYGIEFSKYLKIGANGTKLLSRDLDDLRSKQIYDNTYALVGTYAFTQRQLILYLKLINLKNGVILKASTQRMTLTDEIIHFEQKQRKIDPSQIYQPLVL